MAVTPSVEEYRERTDPGGVYSETELFRHYQAAHLRATLSRQKRRGLHLCERHLDALQRLEKVVVELPANDRPVGALFDSPIAVRLR